MPFRIVIIEDSKGVRNILDERLLQTMRESASSDALPGWPNVDDIRFAIETVEEQVIDTFARADTIETLTATLEDYFGVAGHPNLIVLDLALNKEQTKRLDRSGGRDEKGIKRPDKALERTTGFAILRAWQGRCPILVTTYACNPRVVSTCLASGAHDVVVKPLADRDMTDYYKAWTLRNSQVARPDCKVMKKVDEWMPQVDTYVKRVAHEAIKAIRVVALRGLEGAAPSYVPFWLAADATRINPAALDGTNLMLVDVRGFSTLIDKGKSVPDALFEIMNSIWTAVLSVLQQHEAEVNNFIGDAALIFRGVYAPKQSVMRITDTLNCAREISELFEPDRELKAELMQIVNDHYDAMIDNENTDHEHSVLETMRRLVSGVNFGVRVISIEPDTREALYGRVGPAHRWQHTILSRFMNFLARGESEIGTWEKQGDFERRPGESFLLRRIKQGLPVACDFRFESCQEFLGRPRGKIRDLPEEVEIYRVLPGSEAP
jgi:CheY-like chemotaxis protein